MELTTERLRLRELEDSDALAAHAFEGDPRVVRYQLYAPRSIDESLEYIRRVRRESGEDPRRLYDLGITLVGDDVLVGRAGLYVASPEMREGTLWYLLRHDAWGRGYAPEAARALMDLGFGRLGLHRIFIDCDSRNLASTRVAEKLGMRREAHFVENAYAKGEWTDSLIYGLLDREWRALRAGS